MSEKHLEKPPSSKKISYVTETDFQSEREHHHDRLRSVSKMLTPRGVSLTGPLQALNASTMSKLNLLSSMRFTESSHRSRFQLDAINEESRQSYQFKQTHEGESFILILPPNLASLLNESKLWGCYYILPHMYEDKVSPTVIIRTAEELKIPLVDKVLNRDQVATCLSYLACSPITGNYVYIKLVLRDKNLQDISVLGHYRFIQYLDLSRNFLTDLQVLSHLPYLQYLAVNFNSLSELLQYDTPQWFLTEVNYKYNYVKTIRDLTEFWSITVLDLSHNNIKHISGLHNLRYLRKLDLSFNHIKRLENLSDLRITWLDVSYNNISSFEVSPHVGLKTLLHLEYLNMNENSLSTLRVFTGCSRLRELHCRNNRICNILEMAVYMRKIRNLHVLDLRGNPVCSVNVYRTVVMLTFPNLLKVDDGDVDPVEQATINMQMNPPVLAHASRRLLRLMYVEQLSRTHTSPFLPPADIKDVPIIVIVGPEASGKGTLCRRLAAECSSHVKHALLHTTATHHPPGQYHHVNHEEMDAMLVTGQLLTYNEIFGESYGLSYAEAVVHSGRVVLAHMDQLQALMLWLRYRRPYLILASKTQNERADLQAERSVARQPVKPTTKLSTLQVVVSERIDVTGILHEIMMSLPEKKIQTTFVVASSCSLSMDTEPIPHSSTPAASQVAVTPNVSESGQNEEIQRHVSLHSLYKECDKTIASVDATHISTSERGSLGHAKRKDRQVSKMSTEIPKRMRSSSSRPKSFDTSKHTTSISFKDATATIPESNKSVMFMCEEESEKYLARLTGLLVEEISQDVTEENLVKSASARYPEWLTERLDRAPDSSTDTSEDDQALWCSFMHDMGLLEKGDDKNVTSTMILLRDNSKFRWVEPHDLHDSGKVFTPTFRDTGNRIKDDNESLHRKYPGLYWDTLNTDDLEQAYKKLKRIVKDMVNSQSALKPMFDIDFRKSDIAVVQCRRERFLKKISTHGMFV